MINIYLYYFDNYEYIIRYLKQLNFSNDYSNELYDKYEFTNSVGKSIIIVIYKDTNILAIQGEENDIQVKFKELSLMKKVNLLDKKLFNNLFEKKFSQNLCSISIDIDILGSEEELVEYEGNRLLDLNLLEQFDFYDYNSNTKLKAYSLQPKGYKYILKVSSINKLEFNVKYNVFQIENVLRQLLIIVKLSEEGINY